MSVVAPPDPPRPDELEALIREARVRQLRRRLGAAALVAFVAGAAVAAHSIVNGGRSTAFHSARPRPALTTTRVCGIRVAGPRILASDGSTVYREPIRHLAHPNRIGSQVRCSGPTVWVVWDNGVAASQEGYVGARSLDGGRSWKLVFAEGFFGVTAPHQLVTGYLGPWTLDGPRRAYFTGMCVACGFGTVSLWATRDDGRTFRMYKLPALTGYGPRRIRVSGHEVAIQARRGYSKTGPASKTVRVRAG
jgi:hypothetical protein